MSRQEFHTTDLVRLEVQDGWPDLPNLVPNPSGEGGAWEWESQGDLEGLGDRLRASAMAGVGIGGITYIPIPLVENTGDWQVRGAITRLAAANYGSFPPFFRVGFAGVNPAIELGEVVVDLTTNGTFTIAPTDVPAGTAHLIVQWAAYDVPAGVLSVLEVRDVAVMAGTPADVAASDPLTEPGWTNVLGSTHSIGTERDELDAGFLNATIYDSTLDPASFDLIRPGKRCRLLVKVGGVWEPIFAGLLDNPSTAYLVTDPAMPDVKRTQIHLVANDPAATLAAETRPNGVGTIAELPAVLLGCGVPWNVNGSTAAIDPDSAIVVAVNENASALDQVAITRDSVQGYAWVDRAGTLQAWDAASLGDTVVDTLDETVYSDVDPDFDIGRMINDVVVKHVRINPGTGETEEVEFGPYTNPTSIREWRRRRAEFRIQGVNEADVPAFAENILAANATPAKRIKEVTIPLTTVAAVEAHALRDLYDLVEVSNDRAGIAAQQSRVTSVRHTLTAAPNNGSKWTMTLGFATEGTVAVPQVTPAPGATGKTLAQLLRPVGEVTMWFGAKADIPPGWLPLDGTTFDGDDFPELAELLGGTTLPDMTDRFPIGAGTKALGTFDGNASITLTVGQLPPHTHGIPRGPGVGTEETFARGDTLGATVASGSQGSGDPIDILNPWLSLWFIIRAV